MTAQADLVHDRIRRAHRRIVAGEFERTQVSEQRAGPALAPARREFASARIDFA
jgi:hypothetical protein